MGIESTGFSPQAHAATIAKSEERIAISDAYIVRSNAILGKGGFFPEKTDSNNNGNYESIKFFDETGKNTLLEYLDEDDNGIQEYCATYRTDGSTISEEFIDNETGLSNKKIYYNENGEMVLTEEYMYDSNGELTDTISSYPDSNKSGSLIDFFFNLVSGIFS